MENPTPHSMSDKDKIIYHRMVLAHVTDFLLGEDIFPKEIVTIITSYEDALLTQTFEFCFPTLSELNDELTHYNNETHNAPCDQFTITKKGVQFICRLKGKVFPDMYCIKQVKFEPREAPDYSFSCDYGASTHMYDVRHTENAFITNKLTLFACPLNYRGAPLDLSHYSVNLGICEEGKMKKYRRTSCRMLPKLIIYESIFSDSIELMLKSEDVMCILNRK